jgi:predicted dehydrogenase
MKRRNFLRAAAASALMGSTARIGRTAEANERIGVCVMGLRGRGGGLLNEFASLPDVEVRYVCDIDSNVLDSRAKQIEERTGRRPTAIQDYRVALDDAQVAALVVGTPDHWHALPTIHACQAGKDVYVEKPDGHNVLEGRTMVAAAEKYGRVVQLGTQARSGKLQHQAMQYLAEGRIGKVRFAKAWESSRQGAVSHVPDSEPPAGVDYDRWLGPAPQRPFNPRRFHGSWRWFFDYGTGDLGNDGVHRLDVACWALNTAIAAQNEAPLGLPRAVSAHGGKYYFDDAQEWPDTLMVTYDYPGYVLTYEMRIWSPYPLHDEDEGAAVCGDEGFRRHRQPPLARLRPAGSASDRSHRQRRYEGPYPGFPGLHAQPGRAPRRSEDRGASVQSAVPSGQRRVASRQDAALRSCNRPFRRRRRESMADPRPVPASLDAAKHRMNNTLIFHLISPAWRRSRRLGRKIR